MVAGMNRQRNGEDVRSSDMPICSPKSRNVFDRIVPGDETKTPSWWRPAGIRCMVRRLAIIAEPVTGSF